MLPRFAFLKGKGTLFHRFRPSILLGLLLIIGLFSLLQLMSIAIISNTMSQVQRDTSANDRLREQQALLDQARMAAMNASDKLNRAGIYLMVDKETGSVGSWNSLMEEAQVSLKQAQDYYQQLEKPDDTDSDSQALLRSYQQLYQGLVELADGIKQSNQIDIFFMVPIQAYQNDFTQKYGHYLASNTVRQKQHGEQFLVSLDRTHTIFMIVLGLLLAVSLGVWATVNRIIIRPLNRIIHHLGRIASGDLSQQLDENRGCTREIAVLNRSMTQMQTGLTRLVSQVHHGIDAMTQHVDRVAVDNQTLFSQARLQASALKATTDNILQLNEQLAQHTQHTEQASQHALNTSTMAAHGELMMNDVHTAMSDITGRTKEMTDAIGMIENVAFQTHILSLNAAIEAARAGELGRGFAVVAREVGTLAAQSSQSAQHINVLIRDSDNSVATGAKLVKKLSDSLQNIIKSAQGTGTFLNEIADISAQQTQHIQAVTERIQTLNDTVKQNVSQVEASADTFNALLAQTEQLRSSVTLFTLPTSNALDTEQPAASALLGIVR